MSALDSEAELQNWLNSLTDEEAAAILYEWRDLWSRPSERRIDGTYTGQLAPPGDWLIWVILAGRGYGKTRSGAEWVREQVEVHGRYRGAIVGATAGDVRDICIEGESGLLAISPPWFRPRYYPSKRKVEWPNGAYALLFSADEPERFRGLQHEYFWADELCAWRYPDAWDQLQLGLRLGDDPRGVVTTTPKPVQLLTKLLKENTTTITTGSTYENRANLAQAFFVKITAQYEGTRLGEQELYAKVLTDTPGALWTSAAIEADRARKHPDLIRVVVGVDPSNSNNAGSAECGIVVAGIARDGHAYVLDDLSLRDSPLKRAEAIITAYHKWHADLVVAEVNNGGDLVEELIRLAPDGANVNYKAVRATRGKLTRAEPYASKYEQHKVHHVGMFGDLESQMCTYVPGEKSPDRMDALVWTLAELYGDSNPTPSISDLGDDDDDDDARGAHHVLDDSWRITALDDDDEAA